MRVSLFLALLCFTGLYLIGMEKWFAVEAFLPMQETSSSSSTTERLFRERLLDLERQKEEESTLVLQEGFSERDFLCYNKRTRKIIVLTRETRPLTDRELTLLRSYFAYADQITVAVAN